MTDSGDPTALSTRLGAMERAQAVSRALSEAARRARFSTRARSARIGSFRARPGTKLVRVVMVSLFFAMVVVPDVVVSAYLGLIASDQYISEAKFTVSSAAIPKMDGMGNVTGVPPILIVQDTQVVTNYIDSRAMVEGLERTVGLRDIYSAKSIDWWARFRRDKPIEKFVDYWGKMYGTSIAFPSGIVTLTVRAFSPEDAKRIADEVVRLSEKLINDLNDRMWRDTVLASERDLQRSAQQLAQARMQMQVARNAEGLIDVGQTSKTLTDLTSGLEAELLKAQQEYQTQIRYVTEEAPQMRILKSRIAALKKQLDQVKAQMTVPSEKVISEIAEKALSGKMTKFAELDLEERLAEKRYSLALAAVEAARNMSQRKLLYLHQVIAPALPEESKYPRRWLTVGMTILGSLIAWAAAAGAVAFVRNHMA